MFRNTLHELVYVRGRFLGDNFFREVQNNSLTGGKETCQHYTGKGERKNAHCCLSFAHMRTKSSYGRTVGHTGEEGLLVAGQTRSLMMMNGRTERKIERARDLPFLVYNGV